MGLYTDRPQTDLPLRELCRTILRASDIPDFSALQFCDDSGGGQRRYNVYRVTANGQTYVLKSSERREVNVYLNFLSKHSFRTPKLSSWSGSKPAHGRCAAATFSNATPSTMTGRSTLSTGPSRGSCPTRWISPA